MTVLLGLYIVGAGTTFAIVHGTYPIWAEVIICACWPIAAIGGILLHDETPNG